MNGNGDGDGTMPVLVAAMGGQKSAADAEKSTGRRKNRAVLLVDVEDKQLLIESVLARLTQDELQDVASSLTDADIPEGTSKLKTLKIIRSHLDATTDEGEKVDLFMEIVGAVPPNVAGNISSIIHTGQEERPRSSSMKEEQWSGDKSSLDKSILSQSLEMAKLMNASPMRKDFRIDGKLGHPRDGISIITLRGQIAEGLRKSYSKQEICAAVKRAVIPGEMKTILDSMTNISLEDAMTFIESVLKEKSSSELFQNLTMAVQKEDEDPQQFLMRVLELRQKCLLVSEKPGEVPYSEDLVQAMFLKSLRTGLANNNVKTRVEAFIEQNDEVDINSLIQVTNKIASEEAERECKRGALSSRGSARLAAMSSSPATSTGAGQPGQQARQQQNNQQQHSSGPDIHQTVQRLAEQMTALTREVSRLQQGSSQTPGNRNAIAQTTPAQATGPAGQPGTTQGRRVWYSCDACTAANTPRTCRHCLACGEMGHRARDCPTN